MKRLVPIVVVFGIVLIFDLNSARADRPLPYQAADVHLGVTSCAGSTCHGSTIERSSNVEQNEYLVWSDDEEPDLHFIAYEVLFSDESERIAKNLGLESAHTAEICLACHTDYVAEGVRGDKFTVEDGVGCEACHGGGERYLEPHYQQGATHQNNLDLGLYPTEDPAARASLCLSCHFGNQDKFVTHRIMGAGHPRMSFELDTFTADQPAHYFIDDDYEQRKQFWDGVQTWAIGQTIAARHLVDAINAGGKTGLFPELTLFDCHSCHHSMKDLRWRPKDKVPLAPGSLRLNDAHLLMTYQLSRVVSPELTSDIRDAIRAMHQSVQQSQDALSSAAVTLKGLLDRMTTRLAEHSFNSDDMYQLIDGFVDDGLRGEYSDYAAAEQSLMAIGSILAALEEADAFDEKRGDTLFGALDSVFDTLGDEDRFSSAGFQNALKTFLQVVRS